MGTNLQADGTSSLSSWPDSSRTAHDALVPIAGLLQSLTDERCLASYLAHITETILKFPPIPGDPAAISALGAVYDSGSQRSQAVRDAVHAGRVRLVQDWQGYSGDALQDKLASIESVADKLQRISKIVGPALNSLSQPLLQAQQQETDARTQLNGAHARAIELPPHAGLDDDRVRSVLLDIRADAEQGCEMLIKAKGNAAQALLAAGSALSQLDFPGSQAQFYG